MKLSEKNKRNNQEGVINNTNNLLFIPANNLVLSISADIGKLIARLLKVKGCKIQNLPLFLFADKLFILN